MSTKVSRALRKLKHSNHLFHFETLKTLYRSIIEPQFRYCCSVWRFCEKNESDKLQKNSKSSSSHAFLQLSRSKSLSGPPSQLTDNKHWLQYMFFKALDSDYCLANLQLLISPGKHSSCNTERSSSPSDTNSTPHLSYSEMAKRLTPSQQSAETLQTNYK